MSNFKSGDLVENKTTNELEMITHVPINKKFIYIHWGMLGDEVTEKVVLSSRFRKLSYNQVKINIDKK